MKFHSLICGVALLTLTGTAGATNFENGSWTFGGRVGATQIDGTLRTEAALNAEYNVSNMLTWRTDASMIFLDASHEGKYDIVIPTNLLFWPAGRRSAFRPYIGPGANFTYTHDGESKFGANILGGLQLVTNGNTAFGIEAKYLFPDLGSGDSKGHFSLSLTGAFQMTK